MDPSKRWRRSLTPQLVEVDEPARATQRREQAAPQRDELDTGVSSGSEKSRTPVQRRRSRGRDGDAPHLAAPVGGDAGSDHRSRHDSALVGGGENVGELDVVGGPVPEGVEVPASSAQSQNPAAGQLRGDPSATTRSSTFLVERLRRLGLHRGHRGGGQQTLAALVALWGARLGPHVRASTDHRGRFGFDRLTQVPSQACSNRVSHLPGLKRASSSDRSDSGGRPVVDRPSLRRPPPRHRT